MGSFYTQIDTNKRATIKIMLIFVVVLVALGWLAGVLFAPESVPFFIGFALIFAGVSTFISYYNSDKIVIAMTGAVPVTPAQMPDLHKIFDNMAIASGLPKPRVYIINDPAMNAFATGRDPAHGVVVVTTGLLEKLEMREIEAVIAHELAHIGNYDIRLMSVVTVLAGTIVLLADLMARGTMRGGSNNNGKGKGLIVIIGLVFLILSPIAAELIKLAVSRNREYLADATAVMMTRNSYALASALRKLSEDTVVLKKATNANAHMYIVSPFKGAKASSWFSTHPPISERIKRLEML